MRYRIRPNLEEPQCAHVRCVLFTIVFRRRRSWTDKLMRENDAGFGRIGILMLQRNN
jgi:hypothetical protein